MRTNPLSADAGPKIERYNHMSAPWPAKWVGPDAFSVETGGIWAYRLSFDVAAARTQRVHVSADQRYVLYLNGELLGRGPERGDLRHWMYDSYDLDLAAGAHTLVAIVWWHSPAGNHAPGEAQQTVRPGFFLMADSTDAAPLHTGAAHWEYKAIPGYAFHLAVIVGHGYSAVEPRLTLNGNAYPWGIERGSGGDWSKALIGPQAAVAAAVWDSHPYWLLRPAMLPAMRTRAIDHGFCRHLEQLPGGDAETVAIDPANHLSEEAAAWDALFAGRGSVTLPAKTRWRAIIDLETYDCAFHRVVTQGGQGASVSIRWAEGLYRYDPQRDKSIKSVRHKDNRGEINGRHFLGSGDTFVTDGADERAFESLWWSAGRYVEVIVETKNEPITLKKLQLTHTGYPYDFTATFDSSNPHLAEVVPLALRTLQMCSHETSMDCPFYEQLNYIGDTRLQSLVAMAASDDDRLVRKSLQLFDWSRNGDGWTSSRYPTRVLQTIPTFSMLWTTMVYDYALYRGDEMLIRQCMPGVRGVLERWRQQINSNGLVTLPAGWNFMDWVNGWDMGMSNPKTGSPCGVTHWLLVYVLNLIAKLEDLMNEPLLARRHRQTAAALAAVGERTYFHDGRGLLADDVAKTRFSEHAQVLALISGGLSPHLRERVAEGILHPGEDLARTSIYFSHYTFEALHQLGRTDKMIDRMSLWFKHREMGLSTLIESPEPARSDCHAWGAHPLYHYFASILGIRPRGFGFTTVDITPHLGPLEWAEGTMVHPQGVIHTRFEKRGTRIAGEINVPAGVTGTLHLNGDTMSISQPKTIIS
ncbi:MAG TPA: alpha-L-rhamnosidase C-terminal domain-containing protein [Tepidisphaeraceae bacterium]